MNDTAAARQIIAEAAEQWWRDGGDIEEITGIVLAAIENSGTHSLVVDGQARINGQIVAFEVDGDSRLDGEHLHLSIAGDQEVQG